MPTKHLLVIFCCAIPEHTKCTLRYNTVQFIYYHVSYFLFFLASIAIHSWGKNICISRTWSSNSTSQICCSYMPFASWKKEIPDTTVQDYQTKQEDKAILLAKAWKSEIIWVIFIFIPSTMTPIHHLNIKYHHPLVRIISWFYS